MSEVVEREPAAKRRPLAVRLLPFIVIAIVLGLAAFVLSQQVVGQRTTTDTSVSVVISADEGSATSVYPIQLLEGGDPAHEVDHVIGPLQTIPGISTAKLDWASEMTLTVVYDPGVISEQQIADALAKAGYLKAPTQ